MIDKMIVDADLCIKLGGSDKYRYLHDILPLVSKKIYMHTHAHGEVMMPSSAVSQLKDLIAEGKVGWKQRIARSMMLLIEIWKKS